MAKLVKNIELWVIIALLVFVIVLAGNSHVAQRTACTFNYVSTALTLETPTPCR